MLCAQSHFSASAAVGEAYSGYSQLSWLHGFSRDFDARIEGFTALCRKLTGTAVCSARMILGVTEEFETDISGLIAALPVGTAVAPAHYETDLPRRLGIRIPSQVSYAAAASHLQVCGAAYNGTLKLLTNILSLSCLWNAIRVQGGAYGAGIQCGRSGNMFCYSYRDPSPARSLGVYRTLADFIRQFRESGEALDKFIISTIASTEPLVSPMVAGSIADGQWLCGISHETAVEERRQLLNATMDDLLAWCPALDALARGTVCVVGHSDAMGDCAEEGMTICDV
jgi:Zn-dependent M16 (insulinase) family peptidase